MAVALPPPQAAVADQPGQSAVPFRNNFTVDGVTGLATGSNAVQHFEPTVDKVAETRPMTVAAPAPFVRTQAATGSLTGEVAVTPAATPVQTASGENSTLVRSGQNIPLIPSGNDPNAVRTTIPGVYFSTTLPPEPPGAGKLDPALVALILRVRSGARPAAGESQFVSRGKASIRITLDNAPADSLAQLRKAGFSLTRHERNGLTGRIAVEKLEALAQLPFVLRIVPQ
jgi:hypothetical protein